MIHHGFEFLDINHGSFLELRLKSNFSDYEFLSLSFFFFFLVKMLNIITDFQFLTDVTV